MGSYVYAESLYQAGKEIEGMICLEMVGYFRDEPGSQLFPLPFMRWHYPDKGNFISLVSNLRSKDFLVRTKAAFKKGTDLPVESLSTLFIVPGVDFSDHRSFWKFGYNALMVTDTAKIASDQGIPIYTINQSNIDGILPQLQTDSGTIENIQSAVNAGKEVTVSKTDITYNDWTGIGYIVLDPDTGAGAYMISGGTNGALIMIFLGALLIVIGLAMLGAFVGAIILALGLHLFLSGLVIYFGDGGDFNICIFASVFFTLFFIASLAVDLGLLTVFGMGAQTLSRTGMILILSQLMLLPATIDDMTKPDSRCTI